MPEIDFIKVTSGKLKREVNYISVVFEKVNNYLPLNCIFLNFLLQPYEEIGIFGIVPNPNQRRLVFGIS